MRSVQSLIAAGAASLLSLGAFAADMAIPPPPPMYAPPPVEEFGGCKLRGNVPFSNPRAPRRHNGPEPASTPTSVRTPPLATTAHPSTWFLL